MGDLLFLFLFSSFLSPTISHPPSLGIGLRPVLELAMVYSGGQLKKLGEIRLFRTAFNVPFYSFEKDEA